MCGRRFSWRKKWERDWDQVRSCSDRCRRAGRTELDQALERAIVDLLQARAGGASICPSEAARAVAGDGFEALMERTRNAARRLAHAGTVQITQGGKPVDPSEFRGPIRVRLGRS